MKPGFGTRLSTRLESGETVAFIGVYDVLSAATAATRFEGLLVQPSAFAASHYGTTDVGFMAWTEIATFVGRLRALFPDKHIVVDLDNGCGDNDVLCHAVSLVEKAGASGVILGDQERADTFVTRLARVLKLRRELFVIARTVATGLETIGGRLSAFTEAGADAVLVDRPGSLRAIAVLAASAPGRLAISQNEEDDAVSFTLGELRRCGASIAIYANPCFSAAVNAIRDAVTSLTETDGLLADAPAMAGTSYAVALAARATARAARPQPSYPWTAPAHISAR
jgi:2-methylisocitrate lyase-like PEP mutase family enzyme